MSPNLENTEPEVDLFYVMKKIGDFFDYLGELAVRFIQFIIRNIFIFIGLIVVGIVLGYLLDSNKKDEYRHEIILSPNFDSSSYLYEKVASQQDKLDSIIVGIEVEPIIDVFGLLSSGSNNLEKGEFLSENNINISTHEPGNQTEIIYKLHKLTIKTDRRDSDGEIVSNYLNKLNQQPYFLKRQEIEQAHIINEIEEKRASIQNINNMFQKMGAADTVAKSDFNIEMYPELNGLIESKNYLLSNIEQLQISQVEKSKVFYDIARVQNIKDNTLSYMIIIPLVLILIYLLLVFFLGKYKKISAKIS